MRIVYKETTKKPQKKKIHSLQCSGVHRSLGVHVSKVRSITLDKWTQEMVDNMQKSNIEFNKKYEYHVPKEFMKPTSKTRRDIRTKYITAKYIGLEDFKITNKLIPAFAVDTQEQDALPPVFATIEYDDIDDGDEKAKDKDKGMVEYTGVIQIHVVCASDLPKADLMSASDPYVVFKNKNGQSVKTKTINNKNDPEWNEHLVLSVNENEPVIIEIYDEDDHSKDDLLCTQQLNVDKQCKVCEEVKFKMNMNVEKKYDKQKKHPFLVFNVIYNKMDAQ